ncbi:cytochrome c oxidase cbb3-type subunit 2 [Haloferula luteola]|uniref:Cytochrome c oxidase cbb3-type subunit 2 n=1 Tax=Haloferula luteola TaxID=595692 RepID=A0A840V9Q1_9BACT|nr:hypothetical protein [Haloferula luteola]MBB5353806.1 cytochrome c oxidase cbb3-type subunit 2 [Haloferula luteola]
MNFRTFAIGLTASFGLAWLAVVVVPFFKMRDIAPVAFQEGIDPQSGIYHPKTSGRVVNGYQVYAENGCYQCHTQVVRPTYAGNDLGRADFAGIKDDPDRGDTRRESNPFDYKGLDYAPVGVSRNGPDLMNYGRRLLRAHPTDAEQYLYRRLYNPRFDPAVSWSNCPSLPFLFEKKEIMGQKSDHAVEGKVKEGFEIIPGPKARALASYLMSLQHDDAVPASMNYAPAPTNPEG